MVSPPESEALWCPTCSSANLLMASRPDLSINRFRSMYAYFCQGVGLIPKSGRDALGRFADEQVGHQSASHSGGETIRGYPLWIRATFQGI